MKGNHGLGSCPGLGQCEHSWHMHGCDPYWQYVSRDGRDASADPDPTTDDDVVERRLWNGPDGPDIVQYRTSSHVVWREDQ